MRAYIIHPPLDWQVVGRGLFKASLCCEHQSFNILLYPSERWKRYPSMCLWEWDRETDIQTNRQAAPRPCSGGIGDYMLWSARGPYWGTCRASVNSRFQIKVTGRVKLQNPSPFLSVPGWVSHFCRMFTKSLSEPPFSVCAIYDNTFSPCFHLTGDISTILSRAIVNVTHSTSVKGGGASSVDNTECFHRRIGSVRIGWGGIEVSWLAL